MTRHPAKTGEAGMGAGIARFYTLWAINAPLDEQELCAQLDRMRGWGFDGTVFHPRFYPGVPDYLGDEYMAIVSRVILYAKTIGMEFWLYDEDGWPSGTVGGELLRQYPEEAQQWADLTMERPADADLLGCFEHDEQRWFVARRFGVGVDYLNPSLSRHFQAMTYERYRHGLSPEAFEHVTTFFSDEPEFGLGHAYDRLSPNGAVPWTPQLPELYMARYGEALTLAELFFPVEGYRMARVRFWELLTDLFCDAFVTPINKWCRSHGKRFTLHVKGEEHPLFQVPTSGSCHQVFQRVGLPGIDALERDPSGDFFPRQVSSAARQFGNGDCMVECFGGAGWGATPEDLERYLAWLIGHGLNHFVVHLFQYQLTTHAIHDWPASIPAHVNWRDAFPELLARLRKRAASVRPQADTLLVAPYRGIMAEFEPRELLETNIHNALAYPDTLAGRLNRSFLSQVDRLQRSGVAYDVADERSIERHGLAENGLLRLGHCVYSTVILTEGVQLESGIRAQLTRLDAAHNGLPPLVSANVRDHPKPTAVALAVEWELQTVTVNNIVLDALAGADGRFSACFQAEAQLKVWTTFADEVRDATLNGTPVAGDSEVMCARGVNLIRFKCSVAPAPFVSVCGDFVVRSETPTVAGPNNTVMTDGPFVLGRRLPVNSRDLLASGYPFCSRPLILRAVVDLPLSARSISFAGAKADCARVLVDGKDRGWCWGPDWTVSLPVSLSAGQYEIEVHLIPSTFNFYGPHHHIDGDPHVVSRAQYEYVKNFADRPDAPDDTRTSAWHFKPLGLAGSIVVTGDQ